MEEMSNEDFALLFAGLLVQINNELQKSYRKFKRSIKREYGKAHFVLMPERKLIICGAWVQWGEVRIDFSAAADSGEKFEHTIHHTLSNEQPEA